MRALVLALIPLLAGAQDATQPATQPQNASGAVDGRVTNSQTGEPISGANIHLYPQVWRGATAPLAAVTQADGSFRFEAVPPGSYFVAVDQSSYTVSGPAVVVRVRSGQQVSNLAVQVHPLATIGGTVTDADGKPVRGAIVTAFTTYQWRGQTQLRLAKSATAGNDGEYSLKKMTPGRYFVAAEPSRSADSKPKETSESPTAGYEMVRTFYPKSLTLDGAAALDITPGQDAAGITIQLQRALAHRVTGRAEAVGMGDLAQNATVSLAPRGGLPSTGLAKTAKPGKDGSFVIERVVAGSYTLWLTGSYGGADQPGNRRETQKLLARQEIEVGASDVTGVVLAMLPPIALTGRVTFDDAPSQTMLANLRLAFVPTGEAIFGAYQNAKVNADGSFSIASLDPGEYRVAVSNIPSGAYVQSVQYNRRDASAAGIDLSEGGGGEVDVALKMGAAEVDGTVQAAGGESGAPAGVAILVPENIPPDGSGTLLSNVPATGTFKIRNVPPGRYYAFAIARWTSVWQNADFLREMEREGTGVDVQENAHVQLQISVLPDSEIQQTAARLGFSPE